MKRTIFMLILLLVIVSTSQALENTLSIARGLTLTIPLQGMTIEDFLNRSIHYMPKDVVKDGLPHFGAMRDDWLGRPRKHKGLDIYADKIDVVACAEGRVEKIYTGKTAGGYIKIYHGKGIKTLYMHLTGFSVKPGQRVKAGQTIGRIEGTSGNNYEPQLHFALQIDGKKVDPIPFIKDTYATLPGGDKIIAIIEKAEKELPERVKIRKRKLQSFKQ